MIQLTRMSLSGTETTTNYTDWHVMALALGVSIPPDLDEPGVRDLLTDAASAGMRWAMISGTSDKSLYHSIDKLRAAADNTECPIGTATVGAMVYAPNKYWPIESNNGEGIIAYAATKPLADYIAALINLHGKRVGGGGL